MKLGTWIDGNMDSMHITSLCSYVKNCGCYGNKKYSENGEISDNGGAGRRLSLTFIAWQ